jgi:hypothetical protein
MAEQQAAGTSTVTETSLQNEVRKLYFLFRYGILVQMFNV